MDNANRDAVLIDVELPSWPLPDACRALVSPQIMVATTKQWCAFIAAVDAEMLRKATRE